ncbi:MAG: LptF/LptG family permease [Candidatus Magnetobacterium sp. LHC-1]|uniref:YjgP/YjgQ family permease n=1 Tax=Candidatus Magnetobacterium casense TaxID=1455061 RepID=A0ABS6RZW9_9BACT|nr:LptF/LptG family permease [Candidatus Magnetobacterium casensis]MBF0608806.1 LptF/LptG family permease [Nitrospirota bacterium]MBV6341679.1 YjgP/YjgQ family permease [Candidatus Magnetobacterium casensis]
MTIIERYYIKECLLVYLTIIVGLTALVSVFEVIDKYDKLMKYHPQYTEILMYLSYTAPKYVRYLLPMAALIGTLLVFGQATRFNELIAIKSTGTSMKRLFMPFVVISVILAAMDFAIDSFIASPFNFKANNLLYRLKHNHNRNIFKTTNIWFLEKSDTIVNIGQYFPDKGVIKDITVFVVDGGRLTQMYTAGTSLYNGSTWVLSDVTFYDLVKMTSSGANDISVEKINALSIYDEDVSTADEMSFFDLVSYNRHLKSAGYDNQKTLVDLHAKLSYPFTVIVMMLVAIAIVTRLKMGSGTISVGIAIAVGLVYWICFALSLSMGYSGMIPAFIASWAVPATFIAAGGYLFQKMPH